MRVPPEGLHERFARLRAVVSVWEIRYNQLPEQVLAHFERSDLPGIAKLLEEKRQYERLIPDLREFIARWEIEWQDAHEPEGEEKERVTG